MGVKGYSGKVIKVEYQEAGAAKPRIEITDDKLSYWKVKSTDELLERMALFHIENR